MKVKAGVLEKANVFGIQEVEIPDPGPDEVLIKTKAVGICGSDVHYYVEGRIGSYIVDKPMILGHETGGQVAKVGKNVKNLKEGDRVALEPGVPCGCTDFVKRGQYNLCPSIKFFATPPYHGTFAEYFIHDANFTFKLPDNVSFEEGAMCEPLSVGIHAVRQGSVGLGSRVLIFGAGPIGLVNVLCAKAAGAGIIAVVETHKNRIKMAKECGATHAFETFNQDEILELGLDATYGEGFDVVIECSGAGPAAQTAVKALKPGGTMVFVGLFSALEVPMDLNAITQKELTYKGVFRYRNTYPTAIDLISSGRLDVKPLITKRFPWQDVKAAMDCAHKEASSQIKVMTEW
ncbi:MAG: NAD(P)-dependent alcohol dehydrogenase [Candidatus Obscuribacterales bacterium]|nr:NAD(P)-dependent alcohol dehydrogenase [Candidatus Obscuribacterales bacterium]